MVRYVFCSIPAAKQALHFACQTQQAPSQTKYSAKNRNAPVNRKASTLPRLAPHRSLLKEGERNISFNLSFSFAFVVKEGLGHHVPIAYCQYMDDTKRRSVRTWRLVALYCRHCVNLLASMTHIMNESTFVGFEEKKKK